MRCAWLNQAGGDHLLVFFAGWGMDAHPFEFLHDRDVDVLMLFDYRDTSLPAEVATAVESYAECSLLAWSLGVAVANLCCRDVLDRFAARIAINGTISPVHREHGIAPEIFDSTIANLDEKGLARFIRRTCVTSDVHARYMQNPAQRPLNEIRDELIVLRQIEVSPTCVFTRALAGREDRIFPYANQVRSWQHDAVPCTTIDAPHFPFYVWRSWKEVLHACHAG